MKSISLCFCLLVSMYLQGQVFDEKYYASNVDIEFGPLKKLKITSDDFIGYDSKGGYYLLEMLKAPTTMNMEGVRVINHYDKAHQFIKEYSVVQKKEFLVKYEGFSVVDDVAYLFTSQRIPKEKKIIMRMAEIKNGEVSQPKELFNAGFGSNDMGSTNVISSNTNYFKTMFSSKNGDKFTFIESLKGSKLLLFKNVTTDSYGAKDKNEHYQLNMLDMSSNAKQLWEHKVDMPYESAYFELLDGCADEEGNFYMLGVVFTDKRKNSDKDGRPNYEFKLFKYGVGGKLFETTIKIGDKFVTDMKINLSSQKGNLIATGFYSKNRTTTSVDGICYLSLDKSSGEIVKENYKAFEISMITEHLTEKEVEKAEAKNEKGKDIGLYQFSIDNIITRTDGGVLLVAEQYRFWITTHQTAKYSYDKYHYLFGDILVINITPEGEIEWAKTIHKTQRTINDGGTYSSYAFINRGTELFFFFNDHEENTPDKLTSEYKTFLGPSKKALVALVGMDMQGNIKKELLFKSKQDTYVHPNLSYQINENTMLMQSLKGSEQQFIKFVFK